MKEILILGAGSVAKPHARYLLNQNFHVTIASRTVSKAEKIAGKKGKALELNVKNDEALEKLVKSADLVVSLLPYIYHVKVANYCIEHGKDMVTTSYVSDSMNQLDGKAKETGIILLNETGIDPGIDHMSAMKIIHDVHKKGGKISSFYSYCGGLPAPEANTNPFGYKFSWSPRGVLLAGKNSAKYLKDGKVVKVSSEKLFNHYWL
ncbi:MAG: saccharopine dehydrogenase C-terminal domain-containing protein, partial [Euryarchaeota archaeon]|nr:saccharopine dehydrogenase C-terminal domain-containing protein [Euryarchaeota archaeon]